MTITDVTPSDVLRAQAIRDGLLALKREVPADIAELAALDPWKQTRSEDLQPEAASGSKAEAREHVEKVDTVDVIRLSPETVMFDPDDDPHMLHIAREWDSGKQKVRGIRFAVAGDQDADDGLTVATQDEADHTAASVSVNASSNQVDPAVMDACRKALTEHRRLHLSYLVPSRDLLTERDVDPMRLVRVTSNMESRWYLEAWCHRVEGVRLFPVDRIKSAEVLDVDGTPPAHVMSSAEMEPPLAALLTALTATTQGDESS